MRVEGFVLEPEEVLGRERVSADPEWVFAENDGLVVALKTTVWLAPGVALALVPPVLSSFDQLYVDPELPFQLRFPPPTAGVQ